MSSLVKTLPRLQTSVNKMVKVGKQEQILGVCLALADKLTSSYPQPFEYLKYAHICFLFLDHITNFQLFFEFEMKATLLDDRQLPHNQQQHSTTPHHIIIHPLEHYPIYINHHEHRHYSRCAGLGRPRSLHITNHRVCSITSQNIIIYLH